jgi:hypothetical protein
MPNYAKEARIREILADEDVLDSEHEGIPFVPDSTR